MSRSYVVHMPMAEARYLAGVGQARPVGGPGAGPVSQSCGDRVSRSGGDRRPGLSGIPAAGRAVCGPFVPDRDGIRPPGRVEYLGEGTVRLDEAAVGSLAGLGAGTDFQVIFSDSGPVLLVGADRYPVTEL